MSFILSSLSPDPKPMDVSAVLTMLECLLFPPKDAPVELRDAADNLTPLHLLLEAIRQAKTAGEPEENRIFIEGILALCKKVYISSRPIETLLLAHLGYDFAVLHADDKLKQRAVRTYGIALADSGYLNKAIEIHAISLKLAEKAQDHNAMAIAWNNLGAAFFHAGTYELAAEAYSFALEHFEQQQNPGGSFLYGVYNNLAQCYWHVGDLQGGLEAVTDAHKLETPEMRRDDPLNAIFLRRNYARLLVEIGFLNNAAPLVEEAIRLSLEHPSPRGTIAAQVACGVYEVARGREQSGMKRLQAALQQSRHLPAVLRDTLMSLVQANQIAEHPEQATFYLDELADTIKRDTVAQARRHIELSEWFSDDDSPARDLIEIMRDELSQKSKGLPRGREWDAFERMIVASHLSIDGDGLHSMRCAELAELLAKEAGCDEAMAEDISSAILFHDIGISTIPNDIISKPGPLSKSEREVMQTHCEAGAEILSASPHHRALMAIDVARYHHEWWNGRGYPHGIMGQNIPRPARICALVDIFDALTSPRVHRQQTFTLEEAAMYIRVMAGNQLDPELVDCFIASFKNGAIGRYLQSGQGIRSSQSIVSQLLERLKRGLPSDGKPDKDKKRKKRDFPSDDKSGDDKNSPDGDNEDKPNEPA